MLFCTRIYYCSSSQSAHVTLRKCSASGRGTGEVWNLRGCHTIWQVPTVDRQLRKQVWQVSGETMRWTKRWRQVEPKQAVGRPGSQSDSRASRRAENQQQREPKMLQSTRQTHKLLMCEAKRASLFSQRGGSSSDVVPWRWGVSLQGASDPPLRWSVNALQQAVGPLAQLCQEASKAASAARLQCCVCRAAWYSNTCLIFL